MLKREVGEVRGWSGLVWGKLEQLIRYRMMSLGVTGLQVLEMGIAIGWIRVLGVE